MGKTRGFFLIKEKPQAEMATCRCLNLAEREDIARMVKANVRSMKIWKKQEATHQQTSGKSAQRKSRVSVSEIFQ
jgi:hypothetical protein